LDVYLLPHQVIGVSWMLDKEHNPRERGGILADDMGNKSRYISLTICTEICFLGLGKTVQALALMVKNRPEVEDEEEIWERRQKKTLTRKQTLIVAPAALLDQVRLASFLKPRES
jgi:SNF2 family DNA or RNA helicase